jgi:hypothetical protein
MTRFTDRARALAVALALTSTLAIGALGGPAQGHAPDPLLGGGLYPQNQDLAWRWHADGVPPVTMRTAILAGAEDSNATRASKSPIFRHDPGGTSFVYYGPNVVCGVNGLACMRRDVGSKSFRVYFRPQGHRFDWGVMRWCQMYDNPPDGCYDTENVMLDEVGHVLVLDHHVNRKDDSDYLDAVVQTYARAKPRAGWNAHAYARCDVATLQRQYDVLTTSTPYSTCLDIGTTLALVSSSDAAAYEGTVTFTATLRTADGYGRLSTNALSNRAVVLQRRAGGSTWTDMATMTPGAAAGTYASPQLVRSTGDWRAIFRKPAAEGLRAATSSILTVTVGACTGSICPLSAPGEVRR